MSSEKLDSCVKCCNKLCAANGDNNVCSVEEIMAGDFPWSTLTGKCDYNALNFTVSPLHPFKKSENINESFSVHCYTS